MAESTPYSPDDFSETQAKSAQQLDVTTAAVDSMNTARDQKVEAREIDASLDNVETHTRTDMITRVPMNESGDPVDVPRFTYDADAIAANQRADAARGIIGTEISAPGEKNILNFDASGYALRGEYKPAAIVSTPESAKAKIAEYNDRLANMPSLHPTTEDPTQPTITPEPTKGTIFQRLGKFFRRTRS
jgi:hypothetical protein